MIKSIVAAIVVAAILSGCGAEEKPATKQPALIAEKIDADIVIAGLPLTQRQRLESGNGRKKQMWHITGAKLNKFEIIGNNQKDADTIGWYCAQYDKAGNAINQLSPTSFCRGLFVAVLGKFLAAPEEVADKLMQQAGQGKTTADFRVGDFSFETDGEFYFVRRWSRIFAR